MTPLAEITGYQYNSWMNNHFKDRLTPLADPWFLDGLTMREKANGKRHKRRISSSCCAVCIVSGENRNVLNDTIALNTKRLREPPQKVINRIMELATATPHIEDQQQQAA